MTTQAERVEALMPNVSASENYFGVNVCDADAVRTVITQLVAELESAKADVERFRFIASTCEWDGYGWWTKDVCIGDRDFGALPHLKPQIEEVREVIDAAKAQQEAK